MKKLMSLLAIAAAVLCSCSKDDDKDEFPTAKTMAIAVNFTTLDEQVLDVVDITILGTDFDGNEINVPVTQSGVYRWLKENPTFVDGEYHNPVTLEIKIESKAEPKTAESYLGSLEYEIRCEAYKAGETEAFCSNRMVYESVVGHTELTDLSTYQNVLEKVALESSTYTFDFGPASNGKPNFGWNTEK